MLDNLALRGHYVNGSYALMDQNDGNSRALICNRISGGDLLLHVTIYGYLPYLNVLSPKGLDPLKFILFIINLLGPMIIRANWFFSFNPRKITLFPDRRPPAKYL